MSIISLLKQNGMSIFPNKELSEKINFDHTTLHNPDIPGDLSATEKNTNIKNYDKLKSNKGYILNQNQRFDKLKGKQINGDFLKLNYDTNYGGKSDNQQLEGSINPENIMRKINPLRAPPYDYITGSEGLDFRDLPHSAYTSHDSTQLISKARSSYSSRLVSLGQLPSIQINNIPVSLMI